MLKPLKTLNFYCFLRFVPLILLYVACMRGYPLTNYRLPVTYIGVGAHCLHAFTLNMIGTKNARVTRT